jgi:hypothetical protein
MDTAVGAAISAVHIEDDVTAQRWFEFVCATYTQHAGSNQPDWSQFSATLAEGAMSAGIDSHLVEQFIEQMNANDVSPVETIGRMAELATELPAFYRRLTAGTPPGAEAGSEQDNGSYDEFAWHACLSEHASRWDGTEASWGQFKAWFLYEAEQRGVRVPATGFITYAEGQSDKATIFAEYGVGIATQKEDQHAPDVQAFPDVKHGDSGEWVEYLETMLTRHGF